MATYTQKVQADELQKKLDESKRGDTIHLANAEIVADKGKNIRVIAGKGGLKLDNCVIKGD